MEWKEVRLGDIVDINMSTYSLKEEWNFINYLDTGNITNGIICSIQRFNNPSEIPSRARRKVKKNDIIYSCVRPNQRHYGFISEPTENMLVSTGFAVISAREEMADAHFLYYYLTQNRIVDYLQSIGEQAVCAYPTIRPSDIADMTLRIPSVKIQDEIASVLSSLDAKIETNNRLSEDLEELAQAIFKSWFVDFEPFKNQEFHETELGMIPEGWKVGNLLDIAELYDSQRKPLSSRERNNMEKIYPYYGATSIMDYVDNYIFDGTYLLMGEDGSVVNDKGYPYLQYVFGKFWPNNHAHVMQGKNGFTTEMLHCILLKRNISQFVTGAVQAKLSQSNMRKIEIVIPDKEVLESFSSLIAPLYNKIKGIIVENRNLSNLRDTLLPRLMSGEIKL